MVHGVLTVVPHVKSAVMVAECVIMKQVIVHVLLGTKVQHALKHVLQVNMAVTVYQTANV